MILAQGNFDTRDLPEKWQDGVLYLNRDDLTCGPVQDWPDLAVFRRARAQFWLDTCYDTLTAEWTVEDFLLPWSPLYPNVHFEAWPDLTEAEQARWEAQADFDASLPKASALEVWFEPTPQGRVFMSYALAEAAQLGVRAPVHLRKFPRDTRAGEQVAALKTAVNTLPTKAPLSQAQRARIIQLWQARCALPCEPDPALLTDAGAGWPETFDILRARHPDPDTGLSDLDWILLDLTPIDWTKMLRVIANAMGARYDAGDFVGDGVLQDALERMALRDPALVEVRGTGSEMRLRDVRLTAAGQAARAVTKTDKTL